MKENQECTNGDYSLRIQIYVTWQLGSYPYISNITLTFVSMILIEKFPCLISNFDWTEWIERIEFFAKAINDIENIQIDQSEAKG